MNIKLISVLSSSFDKLKRLTVKGWNGKSRTVTAEESGSYGVDSNPIKGMVAIYASTGVDGAEVIIGYLNKERFAETGEFRIFSTDSAGTLKSHIWLTNDGYQLIGTSKDKSAYTNFATKFNELKTEFNKLKTDHNNLLAEYKTHVHPGVTVGSGATGTTVSTQIANSSNIDNAKHSKIKFDE